MRINFVNSLTTNIKRQRKANLPKKQPDLLVSFLGVPCSESKFQIKRMQALHCPVCNKLMLNDEEANKFAIAASSKKGDDLASFLEKYLDESAVIDVNDKYYVHQSIYRNRQISVIRTLAKCARENPELSLKGLVKKGRAKNLEILIPQQLKIIKKLEAYVATLQLPDDKKVKFEKIIEKHKRRIRGKDSTAFSNMALTVEVMNLFNTRETRKQISEILSKLPNSKTSLNSFFVKYSNDKYSSKDIAYDLILPSKPTAEHIITKSSKGADNTSNYLCDCTQCNGLRGDMPFYEWQKGIPNFDKNLQNYVDVVQAYVDTGKLSEDYKPYCSELGKLLYRLSKGEIRLKTK